MTRDELIQLEIIPIDIDTKTYTEIIDVLVKLYNKAVDDCKNELDTDVLEHIDEYDYSNGVESVPNKEIEYLEELKIN